MALASDFSPARVAKNLLRRSRHGALATLMVGTGAPYSSLVATMSAPDGAPILLISRLAVHTRNIEADQRVSILFSEATSEDPLQEARIMLAGVAERLSDPDLLSARKRYLAAHPSAEVFVDFADFSFFRIAPTGLHLVAGFGRIVDLSNENFLVDLSDAQDMVGAESDIVAHLNADHVETLQLYATRLLDLDEGSWRCVACDPEGLDLRSETQTGRLWFDEKIKKPQALRVMLRKLADAARQHT
jgi:putative heme iron utilization protein